MIKVTLDTNILIKATKTHEVDYDLALRLLDFHKRGLITAQVVSANASENNRSMTGSYQSLQGDLASLGFQPDDLKILPTVAIANVTYIGYSYVVGDETLDLMRNIWDVMYAPIPMDHRSFCAHQKITLRNQNDVYVDRRWTNYMCDVLTVLEYIRDCEHGVEQNDVCILVTADGDDILKHTDGLTELGARHILGLKDALNEIELLLAAKDK